MLDLIVSLVDALVGVFTEVYGRAIRTKRRDLS
jgi:hypothetical protein